jgi:hypothetical protein
VDALRFEMGRELADQLQGALERFGLPWQPCRRSRQ